MSKVKLNVCFQRVGLWALLGLLALMSVSPGYGDKDGADDSVAPVRLTLEQYRDLTSRLSEGAAVYLPGDDQYLRSALMQNTYFNSSFIAVVMVENTGKAICPFIIVVVYRYFSPWLIYLGGGGGPANSRRPLSLWRWP